MIPINQLTPSKRVGVGSSGSSPRTVKFDRVADIRSSRSMIRISGQTRRKCDKDINCDMQLYDKQEDSKENCIS